MLKQPVTQVRLTNVAVVRLNKHGKRFEVACFKNKILNWRSGVETDINEVLQTDAVFQNVSKGKLMPAEDLRKCFGTTDTMAVAKIILEKGKLQVSDKEREVASQAFFKDIATFAADRVFNRRTGLPLPVSLIEATLTDLGFPVAIDVSAKPQSLRAIELLCREMPDDFARTQMLLHIHCLASQREQVDQFLPKIYAWVRETECSSDEPAEEPSNQGASELTERLKPQSVSGLPQPWYRIKFYCSSTYYRDTDHFVTVELQPPGYLHVISLRECVINPNEPRQEPATQDASLQKPGPLSSACSSAAVTSQSAQHVDAVPEGNTPNAILCGSCGNVPFSSSAEFRNHCRSAWHQLNVKRKFKKLKPVTEEEFVDLSEDLRCGFLAVDSI